ncbi:hypothetical protein PTKIN_Ptkin02bG0192400 [Pterospermum kingtungense]
MERVYESHNGNGPIGTGHMVMRHSPYLPFSKGSLSWLDVRIFYVRVSNCETDDSTTPEYLTLNHVPLNLDTLVEVNGVRTGIYFDGASTLLRRDRLDKNCEDATFVSTDSIRLTGSVKFEVFNKETLILSGVLECLCHGKGYAEESRGSGRTWSMNCESVLTTGNGFLKSKQFLSPDSAAPTVEVYVIGSFLGSPIILSTTLQPSLQQKQIKKGMLGSIPEYEATHEGHKQVTPLPSAKDIDMPDYLNHEQESEEEYRYVKLGMEYFDDEEGDMSWFNAGVRVGVGIGLSICVGVGIGVGLLVRTYQGTSHNFRRRLL